MDSQSPADGGGGGGGGGTGSHRPPAAAEFPAGLRVLLVDDDRTCLSIVAAMLKKCLYHVTTCKTGMEALDILRNNRGGFDIVLSDVYMPDMDGFKLLEHVGLEMDLPVIMMSADDKKDVVMKGVTHGACDYLIKPVSMEALKNIWQHVFRKKRNELKDLENSGSLEENGMQRVASEEDADGDIVSSGNEGNWKVVKRKKDGEDEDEFEEREDTSTLKKPRVVWSVDLHQQFVAAVNLLGLDKAVPKKILELMNNPALTRENVASHLQKYRLYLKRVSVPQHQGRADASFPSTPDSSYSSITSLDGFELQALAASGQIPEALVNLHSGPRRPTNICMDMSAADQRGFFTSDAPIVNSSKIRPAMVQQVNNNKMNLLYGSPASMEARQIGQAQQMFRSYGNMGFRVSEGAQGFMGFPSSLRTNSAFSGGTINGHSTNSFVMQMNQHSQQVSLAQQQDHIQIGVKQQQSRGQMLNGIASERDSRVSSTIGQQMVSNGTSNVLVRTGTATNGGTSLQGNYMNMPPYGAVSQSLYPNVQNSSMNGSSCHPHVNSTALANQTSTVMIQEALTAAPGGLEALDIVPSLNGVRDAIPNYDMFNDLQQNKNQEWKLQNVISYESSQQQGTKQSNIEYGSQVATHQDFNATLNDGVARNVGTFRKERFLIRAEIEHEQLECLPQDGLFADDISHEFMSVFGRQPQEPVGPVERLPFEA